MIRGLKARLSFANVMSVVAVFIALGGGAYAIALKKDSVGSKQIKAKAIKNSELADSAVTSPKVKDGSLLGADFAAGQLPNPGLDPNLNRMIPIAIVRMNATGTIISEVHRPPLTGAPTVLQHTPGQSDYTIGLTGFMFTANDAVFCQLEGNLAQPSGEMKAGPSNGFPGAVYTGTATSAGGLSDRNSQCAFYDL